MKKQQTSTETGTPNTNSDTAKGKESKGNQRGRKGRYSSGGRYDRREERAPKSGNDFGYWSKYPVLLSDAIKFPWYFIPGMEIKGLQNQNFCTNTLLLVEYVGTPGISKDGTSPVNLQMRNTWLDMHRKYRGIGSYQFADFGIAMLAIIDIYEMIAELEFIYGMFHAYPLNNRHLPFRVLNKIGFTPTFLNDVQSDLANFRYSINRLIIKARQLYLPKGLSALYNRIGMAGFIYADANNARCSLIRFEPQVHYMWDPTSISTGSALKPCAGLTEADAHYSNNTVAKMIGYVEKFIDALVTDDDVNRMCSDLIGCYGDAGIDSLLPLPEDYTILPTYSEVMLNKIHNSESFIQLCHDASSNPEYPYIGATCKDATVMSDIDAAIASHTFPATISMNKCAAYIVQVDNSIIFRPCLTFNGSGVTRTLLGADGFYYTVDNNITVNFSGSDTILPGHLADTWEDQPSDETRCDALLFKINRSYLTVVGSSPVITREVCIAESFGTELILRYILNDLGPLGWNMAICSFDSAAKTVGAQCPQMVSKIDWHPLLCAMGTTGDIVVGDIDNVTKVGDEIVAKVHDAATLSAFKFNSPSGGTNS